MVKILAIVGMAGSGKSLVANYLKDLGFPIIRFGDIIIREVERQKLSITSTNEQIVREEIRRKRGMDVCAQISLPLIKSMLSKHELVIIDGLYSFSEYKTIKREFGEELLVVAIFTSKALRYERLSVRQERPLTPQEAEKRDYMEIEKIEKGGPIATADLTIINDGSQYELQRNIDEVLARASRKSIAIS
jgi:dephospho-CoA kinase